ncbi:MAG TPA: PP2C family protein-serine/threonine phosphatase [Acidobacteriaceae bacterium]|nr:PP2C family protein-serine/threonine phosphatase [Acidobacteriaceae bacterium]
MRRLSLILLLMLPVAAFGQSLITVSPQHCVWRAGDNPAWAVPNLDESGWLPYSQWKLNPDQSRIWVRCHLEPIVPGVFDRPSVQIRLWGSYEVFMNGALIGRNGNLHSGLCTMDSIRIFPIPPSPTGNRSNILSLRIVYRFGFVPLGSAAQRLPSAGIRVGGMESLHDNRAGVLLQIIRANLITFVPLVAIGIVGLVLLGFSVPDRTHPELILLGLSCIFTGLMFVDILCGNIMTDEPAWAFLALYSFTATANLFAQTSFYFVLARKRMPFIFRLFIGAWIVRAAWPLLELLLPPQRALPLDTTLSLIVEPIGYVLLAILLGLSPFIAFWPYHRIPRRTRAAAGLSAALGLALIVFFLTLLAGYLPGASDLFQAWQSVLFPAQSIAQACMVVALIVLVAREQRQIADQRSALAGEMEAAQKMQRSLSPASIQSLSGIKIDIAFRPARDVGGDFYLCRILPSARQRILLGDVSGKGAAAAMTGAVLLGAAGRRENDSPSQLLHHLNLVMSDMRLAGFATCVCVDLSADGSLTLANAGHLPPYLNGKEMSIEGSLPLGAVAEVNYPVHTFTLQPGDRLTFMTDGVVEAINEQKELFGFDRTREISNQNAAAIADQAQAFGQEDDITVLGLQFTGAPSPALT